ncbi:peptidase M1-like protein [Aquimarina sp. MAR_2010_214]|uniref:ABC transporter permease/M1 family aminopeptidase n=1 Tax=Aquimarina sp. MAR_2010_214 TaxID=1250026 RepID=UPI000C713541|nr:M1 family aminopeptidase [Aquimarina sp. MAR_2010_214]PKV51279.1 peptidase M1-like protein [Aquimarina sp. MAR_2010_214]
MFKTFFFKEISMGLKRSMVYIFFFIFAAIAAIGVVSDGITFGGATGNILKNAPHVITLYVANLSIIALLIATAYFNNAALRDYQNNFDGIIFSTALNKASYFFGRFFGALFLSTIPLLGVFFGFFIGTDISVEMGMASADRMGILNSEAFINNYLIFILPNMFVAGAIIFAVANKWKSTMVSFIATIIIIVAYLLSGTFLKDISTESFAALTDIMGLKAYTIDSKYFTSIEKNTEIVSFTGWLFVNRLLWLSVGIVTIIASYLSFSFVQKHKKVKTKKETKKSDVSVQVFNLPNTTNSFSFITSWNQFISFFKINFYTILKSNTFKILLAFGVLILINKLLNGFEFYGLQSYHVTSKMLAFNRPISMIIGIIILIFFSGELVWRERSNNINGVIDGTPHNSLTLILAKIAALIVINLLFDLFLIVVSILYQLLNGYTNPEIGVYVLDFLYSGVTMYVIWSCILVFIQVILNNKYIAYFVSILLIFMFEFLIVDALGIKSYMLNLGFTPSYLYSDMNGFSSELIAINWFNLYWMLFGFVLITLASLFWVRGTVKGVKSRFKSAKNHFTKKYVLCLSVIVVLFTLTSSFVYYNTQILNPYGSASEIKMMQKSYENMYKKYEHIIQPKIVEIKYKVDIYPNDRNVISKSFITIENKGEYAIDSLHYSLIHFIDSGVDGIELKESEWKKSLTIPNSKLVYNDSDLGYQIYKLEKPLLPGAQMKFTLETEYLSKGFENTMSNIRVVKNGTFFDSNYLLPTFGYEAYNEIMDASDRKERGLKPRKLINKLEEKDKTYLKENYITGKISDWVNVETTISTSNDQTAIAPGTLVKQWSANGRNYFNYKNDHTSLNFTNFMSAKYEVARKKWNGVDIEVYYHKAHDYNIDIMLSGIEKSLMYYTENFGPYFHKQARIIEIPRYYNFAQSFPGTMPYTEGGGFVSNLTNENDTNVVYSIIAHEMAHQYWGHQVVGANVQGATMLSESFSEYAALMVMKHELNDDIKMKRFLAYDFEKYLKGRSNETQKELPLYQVGNQGYIHYGKGSLVLYALQDYIGEERVNTALKAFLNGYKYKETPFPTTLDFLTYLEPLIPEKYKYLITDWFKEITLYDYRLKDATYKRKGNGKYKVSMDIEASKIKVDGLGTETKVKQRDWVDIGVYADTEEKHLIFSKRVLFTDEKMNFSFEIDTIPAKAAIDPKRLLIERVIDDNVKEF